MKKALFLSLLFAFSAMAHAQNDERALAAAIDSIVRIYTEADIVNKFVDEIFEKHKSAYLATRIAKSYYNYNEESDVYKDKYHKLRHYHKNDTVNAFKYINRAIAVDPKYPRAYIVAADILDYDGQTEEAMKWLERGMVNSPNDSSLYVSQAEILARTDIEAAKAKLEELKKADPSIPVELFIARIYDKIDIRGNEYRDQVAEYYGKIDKTKMTQGDLESYVMSLFYSGQGEECNSQAEEGLKRFPHSLALNRFYLRSLIPLKKYSEALTAFENLKKADKVIIEIRDTMAYANALVGLKRYDEAMTIYDGLLKKTDLSDGDRNATNIYVNQCMAARVKDYTSMGEYQKAIDMYEDFMRKREAMKMVTDDMRSNYVNIFFDWAEELNGPERVDKLMAADRILEDIANVSKDNAALFAYWRLVRVYYQVDGRAESGAGLPCVEQLERIIMSNGADISPTNINRLVAAYNYAMGYYYVTKDDNAMGLKYAEKILSLDPVNEKALKVKEIAEKQLGRRRRR